jgi:cytochrome b involved in lipid metabolism
MASTNTPINESVITLEQLAEHDTLDTLWIAVYGRVYNFTNFVSDHPGGVVALESSAGIDGTEAYEYAGHSEDNMDKMQQYYIGKLSGSLEYVPPPPVETRKRTRNAASSQSTTPRMKLAATIIAISFVGVSLCYRYIPVTQDVPQPTTTLSQNPRYTFWAGAGVASSMSLVAFRYLYVLFLSSLDYQNDVFSFPPTIPRKRR